MYLSDVPVVTPLPGNYVDLTRVDEAPRPSFELTTASLPRVGVKCVWLSLPSQAASSFAMAVRQYHTAGGRLPDRIQLTVQNCRTRSWSCTTRLFVKYWTKCHMPTDPWSRLVSCHPSTTLISRDDSYNTCQHTQPPCPSPSPLPTQGLRGPRICPIACRGCQQRTKHRQRYDLIQHQHTHTTKVGAERDAPQLTH